MERKKRKNEIGRAKQIMKERLGPWPRFSCN